MTPLLEVSGICKRFGPTIALKDVSLTAHPGRALALIGENGAGKSTLLKTLSGAHRADAGAMSFEGKQYRPSGPIGARAAGIAIVYQELTLAPELSVEDNILLGQRGTGMGTLLRRQQRPQVIEALTRVGLGELDPTARTADQSVATQQLIEIARALVSNARLILLDEPTSSLPSADVERLFEIIDDLKSDGIGIIYISHFLEEVRRVADDYAVLRDGHSVGEGTLDEITNDQIISLMVGRDVDDLFPSVPHEVGEPILELNSLSASPIPTDISFQVRRGEIFGLAGLVGAGRTELLRSLFGLQPTLGGSATIRRKKVTGSVGKRMRMGLGLLSEDRKSEGLAQDLSITENMTMGLQGRFGPAGFLNLHERNQTCQRWANEVQVKMHSVDQNVSELSGGNQQKVAVGRLLFQDAEIYLLDEPTKGIDVGTKAEIYRMIGDLAANGKTIIFVSSYLPELMAVCDTIGVLSRGRLVEKRAAEDWSEDGLMAAALSVVE
ncbi:MAG: sugar ABC transporter ATP-binding protein [Planctomycetota bacterium]